MSGHVLTVDLEDWHDSFSRRPSGALEDRARIGTERLLRILDERGHTATFFVLGDVARRDRELIREIAAAGHEIASHGMTHIPLHQRTRTAFAEDVRRGKDALEDLLGTPVAGYRAPWWSVVRSNLHWLDDVAAAGHTYDASVFPIRNNGIYGIGDAPLQPHRLVFASGRELLEIPPAVSERLGLRIPIAGGVYWRILPRALVLRSLSRRQDRGEKAVLYLHPWEFDLAQPWARVGLGDGLLHYMNLSASGRMFRSIAGKYSLHAIRDTLLADPVGQTLQVEERGA